ncbi:hypothetical protein [Xanthobacter pseudotagetidis]|uniref:hypothetical protein n=1 Tax=Xanthobacter pseudotagetidis TaxID=3119911 RepID=UPI0037283B34
MRAPFQKAPAPRIRALTGAPSRPKATPAPQSVFRDFVATLERLEKGRRKKKPPAPGGREA